MRKNNITEDEDIYAQYAIHTLCYIKHINRILAPINSLNSEYDDGFVGWLSFFCVSNFLTGYTHITYQQNRRKTQKVEREREREKKMVNQQHNKTDSEKE